VIRTIAAAAEVRIRNQKERQRTTHANPASSLLSDPQNVASERRL
jgi:hypothetical protein